jgi:polar amino acid transport system substrate-binding protein
MAGDIQIKSAVQKLVAPLLVSLCCLSALAQPLHLVTAALPPLAPSADRPGFAEQVAREAFRRIGVEIEVSVLPGERALINANAGLDDGDLLRIPGVEKDYPNLIRIPEKIMDFEFVAYSMERKKHIAGLGGLQPYTVAYATGWKFYEKNVKEVRELTVVNNLGEMFLLLKNGRAEVVLADRWQGLWEAHRAGVQASIIEPPFARVEMFIYLNKRHAALVPKAAKALAAMKADGTYQRIAKELLHPLETP